VPADVAVVGFDDSAAATMVKPTLTTMRNPIERTALEALRMSRRQYLPGEPPWPAVQPGAGSSGSTTAHSASVISDG